MNFLINFVIIFLTILKWIIIFDILLSIFWVSNKNKFYQSIKWILKPFYNQFEKIPHKIWLFDLKPLYLFFLIDIIHYLILKNL